jgi:tetratricopeptide (TPR) repeat protein
LDPVQAGLSEALAHYSQALIDDATPGGQERSLTHWRAAVQGDPTNVALRVRLGAALLQRKEGPEAVRVLEGARALDPNSAEIRLLLGSAYQLSSQGRAASCEYRALIRLAPDHPDGYVRLAALHLVRGQPARAMQVLDAGLGHPPALVAILQYCESLGRLHLVNGRYKEAVGYFERIRDRMPDSLPLREVLARCYVLAGERTKAMAELEELVRRDPRNGAAAFFLAELHEEAGNLDRAEACFDQSTRNSPADAEAFLRLAMLQLPRHRERALETLQRALLTVPDDPLIQAYLGLVYSRGGKFDLAAEAFGRAEAMVAKTGGKRLRPSFYFWYGTACERAGRFEQAEPLLETCIQGDPLADNALNYLAYMWAERGIKLDKALEYVTRALKISPDEGAYVDTLGWVHFKRREYAAALKMLLRALELTPDDATIPEHIGDTLQALGRPREARRYWLKSLKAEPDNAALRAKLRAAGMDPDAVLKKEP